MTYRQRIAINKAEIRKRCKLYGPLLQGARAFREGKLRTENPFTSGGRKTSWDSGWDMAKEKADE